GQTTPEAREAAQLELRQWEDAQRALTRSLADLRDRWQDRAAALPSLPTRQEAASKVNERLPELIARFGRGRGRS
ncbi:MAG: hypothetical protein ACR2J8_08625, partial [Thermomicrobiales bacterium]